MKQKPSIYRVDQDLLIKDAVKLMRPTTRRAFLRNSGTLGSLVLLTGCNPFDSGSAESLLRAISRMNDKVQAAMFDPRKLAPVYTEADITRPFPFNAFYGPEDIPEIEASQWRLELGGRIANKKPWTLPKLRGLPQE